MARLRYETTSSAKYVTFQNEGFIRLAGLLAPEGPLPISRSAWWAGVKSGRYPQPVKLGLRITAWRISEIRELIDSFNGEVA